MSWAGRALRLISPSTVHWVSRYRSGEVELLPPRQIFALPPLHQKIKAQFPFRGGTFFEVGANDGLTQSNTAYLERYRGWRGFLVEPLPPEYARCAVNRPASKVINAALVSDEAAGSFVEMRYSNLMSVVYDQKRSLLAVDEHLALGHQFLGSNRELAGHSYKVPTTTVSRIVREAGDPQIDFFSLDVEGYELEVLKGVDFKRHRPKYFLVEVRDSSLVDGFLAAQNYVRLAQWSHHDILYGDLNAGAEHRAWTWTPG